MKSDNLEISEDRAVSARRAQELGVPVSYQAVDMPEIVPMNVPTPLMSVKPIVLAAPTRGDDLRVKVTAPTTGQDIPIIVFSHGFGSSYDGYGPLVDFWAAHGFVVIQPNHLDSRTISLPPNDPRTPEIWRHRVADNKRILDDLGLIEAAVPGLAGRLDHSRIAASGHSFGGQTAGNLLGLRVLDPDTLTGGEDLSDSRISAGVLLATAGVGGENLTDFASENFSYLNPQFENLTTPTYVVSGDHDDLPLTTRGPDWTTDPYHQSPGAESLLTLFGAEHSLGGIAGYEAKETTDENPARVSLIQQTTWAYLRHALDIEQASWRTVQDALSSPHPLGTLQSKTR